MARRLASISVDLDSLHHYCRIHGLPESLIDDRAAHLCADAEREVLWVLNGHCNSPIAGFSTIDGKTMTLTASVLDEKAGTLIEAVRSGPADRPRELGRAVALDLLDKGAFAIIERTRPPE